MTNHLPIGIASVLTTAILRQMQAALDIETVSRSTEEQSIHKQVTMKHNDKVMQQVLSLPDKSVSELKAMWQTLFNEPAPPFSKQYMIPKLAYRLQSLAYGAMPDIYTKQLDALASALEQGKKPTNHVLTNKPRTGTKLMREHRGVVHEVLVTADGFVYRGTPYKSLSVIARGIVGHRVNGPKWFGLRNGVLKP